jgi:hypothetical protein
VPIKTDDQLDLQSLHRVGVVPREHSTGGQQKLLGISKRGNSYLRRLFVQGARAVLQRRTKQSSGLSARLAQLTSRTHRNVALKRGSLCREFSCSLHCIWRSNFDQQIRPDPLLRKAPG